jgi:hypothetical protein
MVAFGIVTGGVAVCVDGSTVTRGGVVVTGGEDTTGVTVTGADVDGGTIADDGLDDGVNVVTTGGALVGVEIGTGGAIIVAGALLATVCCFAAAVATVVLLPRSNPATKGCSKKSSNDNRSVGLRFSNRVIRSLHCGDTRSRSGHFNSVRSIRSNNCT